MAARARIRFSTSGAGRVTGAFGKVGSSAGKAGIGIGAAFSKIMFSVGRISMLTAGLQKMGKSATGAKKDIKGFGAGFVTVLSAVSKKFAETRRKYYFLKMTGEKIAAPFVWAAGIGGVTKPKVKTRKGKKAAAITPEAVAPVQAAQASQKWIDSMAAGSAPALMSARMYKKVAMAQAAAAAAATAASAATVAASTKVASSAANVEVATTKWQKFFNIFTTGSGRIAIITKALSILKYTMISVGIAIGAIATAGGIAFAILGFKSAGYAKRLVMDFMSIREAFRQYEISLGGIIRNTYSLGKMMKFATKYASEYPAMFEEVLDTFRSLAALPALKPLFRRADEQDLKGIMDVIQGLATLDPIQGVQGAGIALREALSGDMRSIRRRFEISAHSIAEAGGYTLSEITQSSEKALKAFRAFIELNVPAKSMADAAMTIGIQFGNLRDKYRGFVNEVMKSTGAYFSVVTALNSVNDWLQRVFASPVIREWAMAMGDHIRAFVKTLESVLSKVNWTKYIKEGKLVEGFMEAAQRVSAFMEEMAEMWGKPFVQVVSTIAVVLWKGLRPVFWELIKSIWKLFKEGFITAGKLATASLLEGLSSGSIFKSIGSLFATLGQLAIDAFIAAFAGGLSMFGPLLNWISEKTGDMAKAIDKTFPGAEGNIWRAISEKTGVAGDFWTKEGKDAIDSFVRGLLKVRGTETKDSIEKMAEDDRNSYINALKKREAEVVTPDLAIKEQEWELKNLQLKLAASQKYGESLVKQKGIIEAIAKKEEELAKSKRREIFEADPKGGKLLDETIKELGEMDAKLYEARKSGVFLGEPFYDMLVTLRDLKETLSEQYNIFVEQLDPAKDLLQTIQESAESMKEWGIEYEISKKGAGSLLLIVKKLNDILTRRVEAPKKEDFLTLLQERIKLTDDNIEAEKEYKKEVVKTPKEIAEKFTSLFSGIQSSILSFADKLVGAFIGIGKFGGEEPDVEKLITKGKRKGQEKTEEEMRTEREDREASFQRRVVQRIGKQTMIPANLFGMGRREVSYREGLQQPAGRAPSYIENLLSRIKEVMMFKRGPAETAEGRKTLAEMRMSLLEKKIPFTEFRSEERADIYARMAGAQTDILQATLQAAKEEMIDSKGMLAAAKQNVINTGLALSASEAVRLAVVNLKLNPQITVNTGGTSPTVKANAKNTETNPTTGPFVVKEGQLVPA